jgi:hypothetical protein
MQARKEKACEEEQGEKLKKKHKRTEIACKMQKIRLK